jgi:hypothetical protein
VRISPTTNWPHPAITIFLATWLSFNHAISAIYSTPLIISPHLVPHLHPTLSRIRSFNEASSKTKTGVTGSANSYRDQYLWKTRLLSMEYYYLYPKYTGGAYGSRDLYISYYLNDYAARLQRIKNGKYTPKDF